MLRFNSPICTRVPLFSELGLLRSGLLKEISSELSQAVVNGADHVAAHGIGVRQ